MNPVLDCFSLDICQAIDFAVGDSFLREKKRNILNRLKEYVVGFDRKLKPALDEYNEATTYMSIQERGILIEGVAKRRNEKTPDFKLDIEGETFFLEMKTLGFSDGESTDRNYIDAIEKGLDAKVSLEQQIKSGRTVGIAETGFDPLQKQKTDYLQRDRIYFVETLVQKIQQNLKQKQFELGRTVLLIDLSLIYVPFGYRLNSIPFFQEPMLKSIVSGLLWNIAFGRLGERIFSPIRFEGASNIEGQLKTEGILNDFDWIKGLCFQTYNVSQDRAIVGFYRSKEEDEILHFLSSICDFTNDDSNANGWEVLQKI